MGWAFGRQSKSKSPSRNGRYAVGLPLAPASGGAASGRRSTRRLVLG